MVSGWHAFDNFCLILPFFLHFGFLSKVWMVWLALFGSSNPRELVAGQEKSEITPFIVLVKNVI
jgi:hypothetical protein